MPIGAVSAARTLVRPSTANLAAWYEPMPADPPTRPPIEENWMTVPPPSLRSTGMAALDTL